MGGILQASRFYLDSKISSLKNKDEEAAKKKTKETVSNLEKTISQQENKLEIQSKEIENQRLKIETVESETRPRRIPKDAIAILRTELSKNQGESIVITCPLGDQEANSFAEDLKKLFESSGWNVNGVNLAIYSKPIKGLIIVIKEKSYESKAQNIIDLLKIAGFHCIGERNEEADGNLGIVVGNKE